MPCLTLHCLTLHSKPLNNNTNVLRHQYDCEMSLERVSVTEVSSVDQYIRETIENRGEFEDDAFIVVNLSEIQDLLEQWYEEFPSIELFFTLNAQNNANLIQLLTANNCGFDVASLNEMMTILNAGVAVDKLIYGQPYKQPSHLLFALQSGVISVCDSVDEIRKVGELAERLNCTPKILLRILPDDKEDTAGTSVSSKYGAPIKRLPELAKTAEEANVTIFGISFNVGFPSHSSQPHVDTIRLSRVWWDMLETQYSCKLEMLDIGGGYPCVRGPGFRMMAKQINDGIDEYYGDIRKSIRIIAKPSRAIVTSSLSVVTNVIAEKGSADGILGFVLNTGVYGALNHTIWDPLAARSSKPYLVRINSTDNTDRALNSEESGGDEKKMMFWGPTCQYVDRMLDGYHVDSVKRGDWIVFPDHGAYVTNCMTTFNGFDIPAMYFVYTDLHGDKIQKLLQL